MLFTYNKFWQTLVNMCSDPGLFTELWGFEFVLITLLALILANMTIK